MDNQKLPNHVEIDLKYFPQGIGPGGFSPSLMEANAAGHNRNEYGTHEVEIKSWVVLWLLDHVDWDKVERVSYHV